MRGTPCLVECRRFWRGIIPAYAGNTRRTVPSCRPDRDHPRVCGEHSRPQSHWKLPSGSSPRMRGTPSDALHFGFGEGIIPAYAGNTDSLAGVGTVRWDHPRVCGEHATVASSLSVWKGSSPRMRGTLGLIHGSVRDAGIIPAYAGNTMPPVARRYGMRDHPRVCGEHTGRPAFLGHPRGSSPRMRGTPR